MKLSQFFFSQQQPERIDEMLNKEQIHALVAPMVEDRLLPLGFQMQKPLHWIENASAPIRKIFCFSYFKGASVAPSWGLSLDYVPHVSGSQVKWHRTDKSAMLDLCISSRDSRMDMCYLYGNKVLESNLSTAVSLSVGHATNFFASVKSITDLPDAFERTKKYYGEYRGLGYYNYAQHPIAYAFTLAKLGDTKKTEQEFEQYYYFKYPNTKPAVVDKLRKLFAKVREQGIHDSPNK